MPYYDLKARPGADPEQAHRARDEQIAGWSELGRYVRRIDPFRRPVTIHPNHRGRDQVQDESVLDFDMLQTGHAGHHSIPNNMAQVAYSRRREPTMPVVVGETCYEGILHGTSDEVQRLAFWGGMLSGAAGHTYGANGLWQVNTRERPFGPSPHGGNWGQTPWEDACRLPGSGQLGIAKGLLERYPWWRFEPHQEWIEPAAGPDDYFAAYAAGIPAQLRVIYLWRPTVPWGPPLKVTGIEPDARYAGFFFDPRTGAEHPIGDIQPDARGDWNVPYQPTMQDWVLVMQPSPPK